MEHDELSLKNLTHPDLSPALIQWTKARHETSKLSYQKKYGQEEGSKRFYADLIEKDRSRTRRFINTRIYRTGSIHDFFDPEPTADEERRFETRLHEVYGDLYDELVAHRVDCDPRVAELLIQEAMRTGVWEELPKELWEEYWKRVRGDV